MMGHETLPPSVNFHLWQPCNMRCRFCFATFEDVRRGGLPRGHLPKKDALAVVRRLAAAFEKITFAGGEATLCPWLPELMEAAHRSGATTMLVTNGSAIDPPWLSAQRPHLDWLTLSIDSAVAETLEASGRAVRGRALPTARLQALADRAHALGMGLKVNTVVHRGNHAEDLGELIAALRPARWKILQVLPVVGQNDGGVAALTITPAEFHAFVVRHRPLERRGIVLVPEDNEAMTGSYAMVDPAGRFFDNAEGRHRYSRPILEAGIQGAWGDVVFENARFEGRGGVYAW